MCDANLTETSRPNIALRLKCQPEIVPPSALCQVYQIGGEDNVDISIVTQYTLISAKSRVYVWGTLKQSRVAKKVYSRLNLASLGVGFTSERNGVKRWVIVVRK